MNHTCTVYHRSAAKNRMLFTTYIHHQKLQTMKKIICTIIVTASIGCFAVQAQEQPPKPPKRPSAEERLKHVNTEIAKKLTLTEAQQKIVAAAYKNFFAEMDKLAPKEPPPPPPPPVKKEDAERLSKERDDKIKATLSADQYNAYLELEKTLRPPHHEKRGEMPPPPPNK